MWLESWRDSLKNYSQWVNVTIGGIGSMYPFLTPELKADLPVNIVTVMAILAFANIVIRNWPQKNKRPPC